MSDSSSSNNLKWFSTISKYLILLSFSGVLAYKLIITPFQLTIDFLALLSIALALFSVGLSATFYFKATETSNAFYDNTFKYTKEIAELLVRIESGFGERLKHLDESYTYIQDKVMSSSSGEDVGKAQEKLLKEEQELQQKLQERDKFIEELATKAKLEGNKKEEFLLELKKKDGELENARHEIETLRGDILELKQPDPKTRYRLLRMATEYIKDTVIPMLKLPSSGIMPSSIIIRRWTQSIDRMNQGFIRDIKRLGFANDDGILNSDGITFIRELMKKNHGEEEIPF